MKHRYIGWQLAIDEVTDLLEFYSDSPVDSFAFERLGYDDGACFCQYSRDKFKKETGTDLGASSLNHLVWKGNAVREYLKKYAAIIHEVQPRTEVWAHTGGEPGWGHFPHVLSDAGIKLLQITASIFLLPRRRFINSLIGCHLCRAYRIYACATCRPTIILFQSEPPR